MQLAGVLMQKASCCNPELQNIQYGIESFRVNAVAQEADAVGVCKPQNRRKLLDRTSLNTCKLLITDNARFPCKTAKMIKDRNSNIYLQFARKPGWKYACYNRFGIIIRRKKTNKHKKPTRANHCADFPTDFGIPNRDTEHKTADIFFLAMAQHLEAVHFQDTLVAFRMKRKSQKKRHAHAT